MQFEHVLVVGAGQMGGGIAQVMAASGRRVSLHDAAPGAVERGLATVRKSLQKLAAKGGGWDSILDVLTADSYGTLLIAKTAAFVLLIILAWLQRGRAYGDLLDGGRPFWQVVGTELFIMAVALGLSVALSQTA